MSTPSVTRWYRWRTHHAHGSSSWHYAYATLVNARQTADDESDGIRGYDCEAIAAPPKAWVESQIESLRGLRAGALVEMRRLAAIYPR